MEIPGDAIVVSANQLEVYESAMTKILLPWRKIELTIYYNKEILNWNKIKNWVIVLYLLIYY